MSGLAPIEPSSDPADAWQVSRPRHEIKFVGPARAAPFAAASLEAVCAPDDEFPGNIVHSVYFDTPDLASYAEKANGDYLKTKLRLRWYARSAARRHADGGAWTAWLEVNYTFRAREGTDWSAIRSDLEALAPLTALSVLRTPQGGV